MKLLALLILLLLRRIDWRQDPERWRAVLERILLAPWPLASLLAATASGRLLVLVLFWAVVGFGIRFGVGDWLYSLPLLLMYVALLWSLIGRARLATDLDEYLRLWFLHDAVALRRLAQTRFLVALPDDAGPAALHRAVLQALFVRAFREYFSWLIVFAFTGLPGLLAYAVIDAACRESRRDVLLPQMGVETRERVDWLTVRLLGLTQLLTGNSSRIWPILDSRLLDDEDPSTELAADLGLAAAGISRQPTVEPDAGLDITDARGLLLRSTVVWILLMAVSVIIGF